MFGFVTPTLEACEDFTVKVRVPVKKIEEIDASTTWYDYKRNEDSTNQIAAIEYYTNIIFFQTAAEIAASSAKEALPGEPCVLGYQTFEGIAQTTTSHNQMLYY